MAQKQDVRTQLLTASPFQLMLSLSVPAIIGMVVVGLYAIVKTTTLLNFALFGGKKMINQEKAPNVTWSQFEVCNPDTRTALENMSRLLFNAFFFDGKGLFHSDPNNPGIEIMPIFHKESRKQISFQAKYFASLKNAYSQINKLIKTKIRHRITFLLLSFWKLWIPEKS